MNDEELISIAREVQQNAYAVYSQFKVGAALLSADGRIYKGVNVENSSYGLTICAERSAVCNAVSAGSRNFDKLAIYSSCTPPAMPCGACRQVLFEFAPNLQIICANDSGEIKKFTLSQLLPNGFKLKDI